MYRFCNRTCSAFYKLHHWGKPTLFTNVPDGCQTYSKDLCHTPRVNMLQPTNNDPLSRRVSCNVSFSLSIHCSCIACGHERNAMSVVWSLTPSSRKAPKCNSRLGLKELKNCFTGLLLSAPDGFDPESCPSSILGATKTRLGEKPVSESWLRADCLEVDDVVFRQGLRRMPGKLGGGLLRSWGPACPSGSMHCVLCLTSS